MRHDTCMQLIKDFEKSTFYPKNDSHGGTPKSSAENHVLSFLRYSDLIEINLQELALRIFILCTGLLEVKLALEMLLLSSQ